MYVEFSGPFKRYTVVLVFFFFFLSFKYVLCALIETFSAVLFITVEIGMGKT